MSYRVAVNCEVADVGKESTGIVTIPLQKMAHLAKILVYISKSHFHCVTSGEET